MPYARSVAKRGRAELIEHEFFSAPMALGESVRSWERERRIWLWAALGPAGELMAGNRRPSDAVSLSSALGCEPGRVGLSEAVC